MHDKAANIGNRAHARPPSSTSPATSACLSTEIREIALTGQTERHAPHPVHSATDRTAWAFPPPAGLKRIASASQASPQRLHATPLASTQSSLICATFDCASAVSVSFWPIRPRNNPRRDKLAAIALTQTTRQVGQTAWKLSKGSQIPSVFPLLGKIYVAPRRREMLSLEQPQFRPILRQILTKSDNVYSN